MFGEVISVDAATGDGVIMGEDQQEHPFAASACRGRLQRGQKVEFSVRDGAAVDVFKVFARRQDFALKAPAAVESEPDAIDTPLGYVRGDGGWNKLLWSAEGRIRRRDYWKTFAVVWGASLLLGWIPILGNLVGLATIWPYIAMQSKRLHDLGRTGWLQLLPYAVWLLILPITLMVVSQAPDIGGGDIIGFAAAAALPIGVGLIGNLAFFLWIGCAEGQSGPNRFGPDPRNSVQQTAETFA